MLGHVARNGLLNRRLQRPEVHSVVFGAGNKHDSFQTRCGASYCGDRVHQHVAIWARKGREIRCTSRSSLEGRVENVRNVRQLSELAFRVSCVKEIDCDMSVT